MKKHRTWTCTEVALATETTYKQVSGWMNHRNRSAMEGMTLDDVLQYLNTRKLDRGLNANNKNVDDLRRILETAGYIK